MNWRSQPDEDTVTVHVSPRGGLYVKPAELLRSKAAQEMIAKMDRVLRAEGPTCKVTRPLDQARATLPASGEPWPVADSYVCLVIDSPVCFYCSCRGCTLRIAFAGYPMSRDRRVRRV